MKLNELKVIIKQAVKEAIQEELKDIIIESIKSSNNYKPDVENKINNLPPVNENFKNDLRENYQKLINFNTNNIPAPYQPGFANTMAEGSSLPEGEVSLDQIANFISKK